MLHNNLQNYRVILASQSPRRQGLLKELGFPFDIVLKDNIEEIFPENLSKEEIATHLAELKASAYDNELVDNTLLITADTIVWLDGEVLGKPVDYQDAFDMLRKLSGKQHTVVTGVCIKTLHKKITFSDGSEVYFKSLSDDEIRYYLDNYRPYDKAGAYGAQEWIGYIAIQRIDGSYFNVMGLPIHKVYETLSQF